MDKRMMLAQCNDRINILTRILKFFDTAYCPAINLYNSQIYGKPIVESVRLDTVYPEFKDAFVSMVKKLLDSTKTEKAAIESTLTLGELMSIVADRDEKYSLYILGTRSGNRTISATDDDDLIVEKLHGPATPVEINQWISGMLPAQGGDCNWANAIVMAREPLGEYTGLILKPPTDE